MENPPAISILLPFYNPGETLKQAIRSIRNQSFPDWELILVNNACTDGSETTALEMAAGDSRIVVVDEPAKGIVYALNTGLEHCRAPLIARMDADDISLPHRLQLQYKFMKDNPATDLSAGLVQHLSPVDNTRGYALYVKWINELVTHDDIALNCFIESPFAHPSVIFRKSSLEKFGGYREGDFPEDYEMWLRWLEKGAKMAKVNSELLQWNDTPGRLSRIDRRYDPDAFFRIKIKYLDQWLRRNNPFYPKLAIWGAGRFARKRAKQLEQLGHQVTFYIDIDPVKARRDYCRLYSDIETPGEFFILSLTGKRGARQLIRKYLSAKGFSEGKDFLLAAGI